MNPKIQRLHEEITKARKKLTALQAKLKEMEQQKRDLEDAEIIAAVRGMNTVPEDFDALLDRLRESRLPNPATPTASPTTQNMEDIVDED